MQTQDRLEDLIGAVVADPALHARWLNTFSYLEYVGFCKIVKSQRAEVLTAAILGHACEEGRHALGLKRLAIKLGGAEFDSYAPEVLLCGEETRAYFQDLDKACDEAFAGRSEAERGKLTYCYVTWLVERRALDVYHVYRRALGDSEIARKLGSLLGGFDSIEGIRGGRSGALPKFHRRAYSRARAGCGDRGGGFHLNDAGELFSMRASEAEILVIPGLGDSGPDHWQSRWEAKIPAVRRVVQADRDRPELAAWRDRIVEEVARASRPVVLVAHSLGVLAAVHAAPFLAKGESSGKVKGAFLVAPPSIEVLAGLDALDPAFLTVPGEPLPFPALVIASRDDPFASFAESEALARTLGAELIDAGFSGHINSDSGHGPWPEGLMRFAGFLKTL
jgi:predicted alpha/beta hydrolase family esterase